MVRPIGKEAFLRNAAKTQKLSLASKYLGFHSSPSNLLVEPEEHLPPITKANFELSLWEENYIEHFEYLSLLIRQTKISPKPSYDDLPAYGAKLGSSKAYRPINADWISGKWIREYFETHKKGANLKLVGYHIYGDIDLSGFRECGSLRLICCHIEGAFLFDRATFRTLDLSGSVIEGGMSGAHSEITGALRMRRIVSKAPVDMPGVRVDALTDFSDCIIFPFNMSSQKSSFVTERGMLNLSGGKLRLGARFQRSRIYGLTNLRGAEIGVSFQANDAVLSSSLATFETLTLSYLKKMEAYSQTTTELPKDIYAELPAGAFAMLKADEEIARRLFCKENDTDATQPLQAPDDLEKKQIELETLGRDSLFIEMLRGKVNPKISEHPENFHLQLRLMREDHRAAETALRMEGTTVHGPVYFNGSIISGRVKMSGIHSEDRLSFDGAKLRSPESIRRIFAEPDGPTRFRRLLIDRTPSFEDDSQTNKPSDYALATAIYSLCEVIEDKSSGITKVRSGLVGGPTLDLLGATIGGRLTFDRDWRFRRVNWLDLAEDDDTLDIIRKTIEKKEKFDSKEPRTNRESYDRFSRKDRPMHRAYKSIFRKEELSRRAHISGHVRLSNAAINGDVVFQSCLFNITDSATLLPLKSMGTKKKGPKTITMKRCVIVGKLDFRCSHGLHRLDARNATISGGLMFSDPPNYDPITLSYSELEERAHFASRNQSKPEINLKNIKVGGNAVMVFNHLNGPTIKASYSRFEGQLIILPAIGKLDMGSMLKSNYALMRNLKPPHKRLLSYIRRRSLPFRMLFRFRIWNPFDKKVLELYTSDKPQDIRYFDHPFEPAITDARDEKKVRISLGGAHASSFAHHPLAWPSQDGLKITGFEYQTTQNFGPLGFGFRMWDGVKRDVVKNARRSLTLSMAMIVATLALYLSDLKLNIPNFNTSDYCSSLISALIIVGFLFSIPMLANILFRPNNITQTPPTAVDWLRLQRRHFPKRRAFSTSRPTDAYLRAAVVMRNAGRDQEAATIELARLKERLNSWSNRSGLISKILSWCLISIMTVSPRLGWLKFLVALPVATLFLYLPSDELSRPLRLLIAVDSFLPFTNIVPIEFGPQLKISETIYLDKKYVSAFRIHAVWGWLSLPTLLGVLSARMESFIAKTKLNLFE